MTLLRRAPREVYRVYSEEEFLADPLCDKRMRELDAARGGRRLNRIAGMTVLVAATGAVGGLVAWTSAPSIAGSRRRERERSHPAVASVGQIRSSAPRVWRVREGVARRSQAHTRVRTAKRRGGTPFSRARARRRDITPSPISTLRSVSASDQGSAPSPQTGRAMAVALANTPPPATAVAVRPTPPGQSEFGFER